MSLSEQIQRVDGGQNAALKTILQKLGVTVGDEKIDQYAALAAGISQKLLPENIVSSQTLSAFGLGGDAVPDDVLQILASAALLVGGKLQTPSGDPVPQLQAEYGSYVGTGTYGQSKPTSITFSQTPKMLFIFSENARSDIITYFMIGLNGCDAICYGSGSGGVQARAVYVTWGSVVSFYTTAASDYYQMNHTEQTYRYLALV